MENRNKWGLENLLVLFAIFLSCLLPLKIFSQSNPNFNITLNLDYASAERMIDLYEDRFVNTDEIASLRGNRIAASTTGLIAHQGRASANLRDYLDSLKIHAPISNDIFHLESGRERVAEIKAFLAEIKKSNFSRRVTATVEQIFPQNSRIDAEIPVYFVALGHENVDAYVRRIVWHGDVPEFVGENEGKLTIVVNLSKAIDYPGEMKDKIITLLGVVAHEVFHAAFGVYKDNSPVWKRYFASHNRPFDALADLTQNEGIAYYLSLDQEGRGYLPRDWSSRVRDVFKTFNQNGQELLSDTLMSQRASELIRSANLSGYWESYGAMTGMVMAREIDLRLGRAALIETIALGPGDFFQKYISVADRDGLPGFDQKIIDGLGDK
ncbi:MAG: DUF5700 domain-containing putative Zn-dependent protease [Bacteroidota bacterium]